MSRFGILFGTRISHEYVPEIPIHHKCRNCGKACDTSKSSTECIHQKFTRTGTKDQPAVLRAVVPDKKVRWSTNFDYNPVEFTSEKVKTSTKEYIDRDPRYDHSVVIPWNSNDVLCDRRSYHGFYDIVAHLPRNPCGRTGIQGRGHLGRDISKIKIEYYAFVLGHFGPNHAADPIVTRWKRDEHGLKQFDSETNKPILQFVCIRRRDTGEYAIPGGMVDRKERMTETLQREFIEEALNFPAIDQADKNRLISIIKDQFENGGVPIYTGYVDDPR
jgi:ADP-ribose pyrophosphatase